MSSYIEDVQDSWKTLRKTVGFKELGVKFYAHLLEQLPASVQPTDLLSAEFRTQANNAMKALSVIINHLDVFQTVPVSKDSEAFHELTEGWNLGAWGQMRKYFGLSTESDAVVIELEKAAFMKTLADVGALNEAGLRNAWSKCFGSAAEIFCQWLRYQSELDQDPLNKAWDGWARMVSDQPAAMKPKPLSTVRERTVTDPSPFYPGTNKLSAAVAKQISRNLDDCDQWPKETALPKKSKSEGAVWFQKICKKVSILEPQDVANEKAEIVAEKRSLRESWVAA